MNTAILTLLVPSLTLPVPAEHEAIFASPVAVHAAAESGWLSSNDPPRAVARHFELAQRAGSKGRVATTVDHIRRGLAAPSRDRSSSYDKARLETWAIAWREQAVLANLAAGRVREARELMDKLSVPLDSKYAEDRAADLHRRVAVAEHARANRDRGRVTPLRAKMMRRIQKSELEYERGKRDLERAQSNSRRTVYSATRAEAALRRMRSVESDAERWLQTPKLEPRTIEQLVALRIRAEEGVLRAMMRIANARTTQGSFREALRWVDRVVALAPTNAEAQELRRTIQLASAASSPWVGWGPILPVGSTRLR